MSSGKFNWSLLITIAGLAAVFVIIQSPGISNDAVLPALGGVCMLLGLTHMRSGWMTEKRLAGLAVMQTAMGAVILAIGIVEALHIELPQLVWNLLLVAIPLLLLLFALLRRKRNR